MPLQTTARRDDGAKQRTLGVVVQEVGLGAWAWAATITAPCGLDTLTALAWRRA